MSCCLNSDINDNHWLKNDELALDVDRHIVECAGTEPIEMRRSFLVGQSLLDEDIGADEIKLRVWARDSAGGETSADTGIVRGDF